MKRLLLLLSLAGLVFAVVGFGMPDQQMVTGELMIPAADIYAQVSTNGVYTCDCCPPLWNGGIAMAATDLSNVKVDDMACLTMPNAQMFYLTCAEVVPCVLLRGQLLSWRGIIEHYGDILIYSHGYAYRFSIL